MTRVRCPCGAVAEHGLEPGATVGAIADATGFFPVFSGMGGITYICPVCTAEVRRAVEILNRVLGEELCGHASLYQLSVGLKKREKTGE